MKQLQLTNNTLIGEKMNLTITLNTDNAAFCDTPEIEAARILHELADRVEATGLQSGSKFKLHDFNGNTVGELKATK